MFCPIRVFWLIFIGLLFLFIYCDLKFQMLRDTSTQTVKPYSWSRVQLAWWTLIIITSFITIICCTEGHQIPTLDNSTLILLGITTGTSVAARLIDISDQASPNGANVIQNQPKQNFLLDMISDGRGVSIHRLQALIFNLVFGIWFIEYVLHNFQDPCAASALAVTKDLCAKSPWDYIMPVISTNNLFLLGISSATYTALKTTENSSVAPAGPPAPTQQQQSVVSPANQPNIPVAPAQLQPQPVAAAGNVQTNPTPNDTANNPVVTDEAAINTINNTPPVG